MTGKGGKENLLSNEPPWTAGWLCEDMIYTMTDAVAAARARKRGLTPTEQREQAAAADAAMAAGKK